MGKKQYNENDVVYLLNRKADIHIEGKMISELKRFPGQGGISSKGDVGIRSKGKIDFLTRYCGYVHVHVDKF